jgi:hypothetical protein
MDSYEPIEITEMAKNAADEFAKYFKDTTHSDGLRNTGSAGSTGGLKAPSYERKIRPDKDLKSKGRIKLKTLGRDGIMLNHETIDLRYVEQLMDTEQLNTLSQVVRYLEERVFDGKKTLQECVEELADRMENTGFSVVLEGNSLPGNLAMPRKQEIYACLNRYRRL